MREVLGVLDKDGAGFISKKRFTILSQIIYLNFLLFSIDIDVVELRSILQNLGDALSEEEVKYSCCFENVSSN
jgi:Ca2+-binding EF-hand superfamily protein